MPLAVLSIDLEAKLAKLQEGMDKAGRLGEKTAARIESAFDGLRVASTAVAGVLGGAFSALSVGTLAAFIGRTVDAVDALNDVADATGSTVENLSALEDVAMRNGGTLEEVSSILVKFNGLLNEVDGKNGASQALQAIGLDAERLKKLDPSEALRQTAVALSKFADDGNKARVVQELFGKSIKEAGPFLKDLAEQGQLNAQVTKEQADQAERFNKALSALHTNVAQAARNLSGPLVEALNKTIDKFKEGESGILGFYKTFAQEQLKLIGLMAGSTEEQAGNLERRAAALKKLLDKNGDGSDDGAQDERAKRLRTQLAGVNQELLKLRINMADADPFAAFAGDVVTPSITPPKLPGKSPSKQAKPETFGPEIPQATLDAIKALERTDTTRIAALNAELQELLSMPNSSQVEEAIRAVSEELGKLDPSQQAAIKAQEELNRLLDATPSAKLEQARATIERLQAELDKTTDPARAKKLKEAMDAVAAEGGVLPVMPDSVKAKLDEMSELARQAGRNIQDAMGATIKDTLTGDFDDIGDRWANLVLDMASQAAAVKLGEALFGDLFKEGGQLGGLFGSLAGGSFSWAGLFSGLFSGGRAGGGPVQSGRLYEINETGLPEIGTFNGRDYLLTGANGHITPMKPAAGAGGGRSSVQHFDFSGQVINVGAGVSRSEVAAALQANNAQMQAWLQRRDQWRGS